MALALPHATEGSHADHPDFRVRNRIFATLWPKDRCCVVKLRAADRELLIADRPEVFSVPGRFVRGGWTLVDLRRVGAAEVAELLQWAWREVAPKRVVAEYDAARDLPRAGRSRRGS